MWIFYALACAVFASVRRTSEKQLSHKLNHFTIGWTVQLFALPALLVALLTMGTVFNPLDLGVRFWIPTFLIWVGFYPLNTYLYINSYKHGELSKILPLASLGPIFALMLGWITLGERPSLLATIGIMVSVLGIYVLNLKGRYLRHPLAIFTADKANVYAVLGILLVTVAYILDKIAIEASEPIYFSFVSTLGAVVSIFVTSMFFRVKEPKEIKYYIKPLMIAGLLFGVSYCFYVLSLAYGPLAYVSALRSSSVILIGSLIGMFALKEKVTILKVAALLLIVSGSILLAIH